VPALLGCVLVLSSGCSAGDGKQAARPAPAASGSRLLEQQDLPDGYVISPPEPAPEVSAASKVSVEGCGALLDLFGDGATGTPEDLTVRFEAGGAGPFIAEELSSDAAALGNLRELAGRCGSFTDTDADGTITTVSVAPVADFPVLGDEGAAFTMSAGGGTGDDTFSLGGYLIAVRLGATTCTLMHFAQPEVDRAETETIARTAVHKLQRQQ